LFLSSNHLGTIRKKTGPTRNFSVWLCLTTITIGVWRPSSGGETHKTKYRDGRPFRFAAAKGGRTVGQCQRFAQLLILPGLERVVAIEGGIVLVFFGPQNSDE